MLLCGNPQVQYLAHKDEIDFAVKRVFEKGIYINGPEVEAFELEFAHFSEVEFGIGVANGTDALRIALMACDIGRGDEVITVSHTAVATVAAIELTGARPVFVDIEPKTFTLDVHQVEQAITPQTRAVIPVHLYGQPADLEPLQRMCKVRRLRLIEDCAQAHGSRYLGKRVGAWGDLSCFSFYPTKNLGAVGDGGMVLTSEKSLADKCRWLREYGWRERFVSEIPGLNSRLDELQAAILRVKLKFLDKDNEARQKVAKIYDEKLRGLSLRLPKSIPSRSHVYHLYVIRTQERDALKNHLSGQGIAAAVHYPVPVHLQPAYKDRLKPTIPLLETEAAAREVLSLPLYPELAPHEIERVVQSVRSWKAICPTVRLAA